MSGLPKATQSGSVRARMTDWLGPVPAHPCPAPLGRAPCSLIPQQGGPRRHVTCPVTWSPRLGSRLWCCHLDAQSFLNKGPHIFISHWTLSSSGTGPEPAERWQQAWDAWNLGPRAEAGRQALASGLPRMGLVWVLPLPSPPPLRPLPPLQWGSPGAPCAPGPRPRSVKAPTAGAQSLTSGLGLVGRREACLLSHCPDPQVLQLQGVLVGNLGLAVCLREEEREGVSCM